MQAGRSAELVVGKDIAGSNNSSNGVDSGISSSNISGSTSSNCGHGRNQHIPVA